MHDAPYYRLQSRFAEIGRLDEIRGILDWDQATQMPRGGSVARGEQLKTLAQMRHRLLSEPAVGDWLDEATELALEPWRLANVRAMRRMYLHAATVPSALIGALTYSASLTEHTWREAREENDFALVAPALGELLALVREEAAHKAEALGVTPYEALMDRYDPGRGWPEIERLFGQLSPKLSLMVERACEGAAVPPPLPCPVEVQRGICEAVLQALGFDWEHGRLDESAHPFTGGVPDDVRITTRYAEEDLLPALFATIHEAGHAQYERGLPQTWRGQPVGQAPGLTMHESQSLGFEMQIARSPAFSGFLARLIAERLGHPTETVRSVLARRLAHVQRTLIRVEADELTYPLHILLRTELERALVSGDLEVADLPEAWRDASARHVGIAPENDRSGCLQDIHWYSGDFGYFPTYALGAMVAAQLVAAARAALPNLDRSLAQGDWSDYLAWCRVHVHALGSRYSADELVSQATGRPLGVESYLAHLEARYLARSAG